MRPTRQEHFLLIQKKDYLDHILNRLILLFHLLHQYLDHPTSVLAPHLAPKPTYHDHVHSHWQEDPR